MKKQRVIKAWAVAHDGVIDGYYIIGYHFKAIFLTKKEAIDYEARNDSQDVIPVTILLPQPLSKGRKKKIKPNQ